MILCVVPDDIATGSAHDAPLFSLQAERSDGRPPLVVEVIKKRGLSGRDFVEQRLMRPFLRQWWTLVLDHRIVMEPRAQNVLLEIGADGLPTGNFLHRDLGGFRIALSARSELGLPSAKLPLVSDQARDYREEQFGENLSSSLYNYFEGGFIHNLDQKLPGWARRYRYAAGFKKGTLGETLLRVVASEHAATTGRPTRLSSLLGVQALAEKSFAQLEAAPADRPSPSRRAASPTAARCAARGDAAGRTAIRGAQRTGSR